MSRVSRRQRLIARGVVSTLREYHVDLPIHCEVATDGYRVGDRWHWYLPCIVQDDGDILVWDEVAGHYTRCHSLTEEQQAEARRLAGVEVG